MRRSLLLFALLPTLWFCASAQATNWYVDTSGDDAVNDCLTVATPCLTLQGAHDKAANGDTVVIAAGVHVGNLMSAKSLSFVGASAQTTVVQGDGSATVVSHNSGSVQFEDVTIRGGSAPSAGGILVGGATACRLVRCRVVDNFANLSGGAILSRGTLSILDSVFSGNQAPGGSGGAIANLGQLRATNTTFSGNAAVNGFGGALYQDGGSATLANVTIVANVAQGVGSGGGIYSVFGVVDLHHVILADNVGGAGGGDCANVNQPLTSSGFNLIEDATGCAFTGSTATDVVGLDPMVAPLALNGGTTETHALLAGSPAIDSGDLAGCLDDLGAPLVVDQRGQLRPLEGDCAGALSCDIGAYEAVCATTLAVVYDALDAIADRSGVVVSWRTLSEEATIGFTVRCRRIDSGVETLPTWIVATGAGAEYVVHDGSRAARAGSTVAYQVIERTVDGGQNPGPWIAVTGPAKQSARERRPARRR